jgi:hypothetical protein
MKRMNTSDEAASPSISGRHADQDETVRQRLRGQGRDIDGARVGESPRVVFGETPLELDFTQIKKV